MDRIREELGKGLPSKRKILSYLLDLLDKDKYPSLSLNDFYDVVGYTYELNLSYKFNLEMLFNPIYNALKKKIKKLYNKEKLLEMEQYLIKNYDLFGEEQTFDNIQEKFEQIDPSRISAFLSDLFSKKEYNLLSESEFIDMIEETFKSNPEAYMEKIYEEVRKRVKKLYGDEKLKEIEKIAKVNKPDTKIFVGESITGNDAIEQAKSFNWSIGIDGIVLTKADVDEKGGTALSVGFVTKKPILFLGTGQEYDAIEVFDKEKFIKKLGL